MPLLRWLSILFFSSLLAACGGGGSLDGSSDDSGDGNSSENASFTVSLKGFSSLTGEESNNVSGADPLTIKVILESTVGNVSGKRITFSLVDGIGTLNQASALTDSEGNAEVVLNAGTQVGAGVITATYSLAEGTEFKGTFEFSSEGDGDSTSEQAYTVSLQGFSSGTNIADNAVTADVPLDIVATVLREGEPISGQQISFSLVDGIGELNPESGTALTDDNGQAKIELLAGSTAGAGVLTASYSVNDSTYIDSFAFSTDGKQDQTTSGEYTLSLKGVSASNGEEKNEVSSNEPLILQGRVLLDGQAIPNVRVRFQLLDEIGQLNPSSGTALTNSDGVASVTLLAGENDGAGEVEFSYTIEDVTFVSDPFAFSVLVDQPVETSVIINLKDSSDQSTRNISYTSPARAQATVTLDGQPAAFKFVTFNLSNDLGLLNPSNGTAMTDAQGVAEIDLLAGTVKGAGSISATYVDDSQNSTVSPSFTYETEGDAPVQTGDASYSMSLSLISAVTLTETSTISADNSAQVRALVVDSEGNAVPNQVVSFSSTLGRLIPSLGTALTDDTGLATLNLTAGSVEGAGTVTAQYDNQEVTIGFYTRGDVVDSAQDTADITFKLLNNCQDGFRNSRDLNLCDEVTSFSNEESGILYVEVLKSGSTTPLEQVLVNATTTIGSISPSTGTAITDENGIALLDIIPGRDVGAGEITVSVLSSSLTKAFQIAAVDVDIAISSNLADSDLLSAGSTALISVEITKEGELFTSPLAVEFSSGCVDAGLAVIDESVTSIGGLAQSTYRATGCVGGDLVTASVITGGTTVTANITVNVSKSNIGSIEFLDSSESVIALKGTGGSNRKETSTLRFKLVDNNGNPLPARTVNFELSTTVGGVQLSQDSGFTNAEGIVQTVVQSGFYPQPVKVIATSEETVDGEVLKVTKHSDNLAISTGVADQNSFSISRESSNIHALDFDGSQVEVTARLSDHFGNAVPDGTVVSFIAEGGMIESNCQTDAGKCSVVWESSEPRPFTNDYYQNTILQKCDGGLPCPFGIVNNDGTIDRPLGGRATILAYAQGEESYNDKNGNGLFDASDFFSILNDRPEAFIDNNEDGTFGGEECAMGTGPCSRDNSDGDEFEEFIDYNGDGIWTAANGVYDGLLCTEEDDALGVCNRSLIHIFSSQEIVMSDDAAQFRVVTYAPDCAAIPGVIASVVRMNSDPTSDVVTNSAGDNMCNVTSVDFRNGLTDSQSLTVFIADIYNNPMPVGTAVTITTDNGILSGADDGYTFPNTTSVTPVSLSFVILDEPDDQRNDKTQGIITIKAEAPNGLVSSVGVPVYDDAAP